MRGSLAKLIEVMTLLFFLVLSVPINPASSQPPTGNWIVTGTEAVENKAITLDGNLTIKSGGSLTLRNVTLILDPQYDGQYGISAAEGSSLFLYDNNISSGTSSRFFFSVTNATFVMKDSRLSGAGFGGQWDWRDTPTKRGLFIQADGAVVEGNTISNSLGVLVTNAFNNSIINNDITTDYGLCLANALPPYSHAAHNLILNNTVRGSQEFGVYIQSNDNVVAHNTVLDSMVGVMMSGAWNTLVDSNQILPEHHFDPWGGIVMWDGGGNNTVVNNIIRRSQANRIVDGIEVVHAVNNLIKGNTIENLEGITLSYSYNNIVVHNILSNIIHEGPDSDPHFYGSSPNAIQLYHSSNNAIMNNQIRSVQSDAILLWENSSNNTIQANRIDSSANGISLLYSSDNNSITNNEVSHIADWTVLIEESSENVVSLNNFMGDAVQSRDTGHNAWSLSGQGNYWSDYNGSDRNADGIGDSPYSIAPNGTDGFPLVAPRQITPAMVPHLGRAALPSSWAPDVTIGTTESWKDSTVAKGRITVREGGTLIITNTTVEVGGVGGQGVGGRISVEPGGSMYIFNSTIRALDERYGGYTFFVVLAKNFVMKNSIVTQSGFSFQTDFPGGFSLLGTNATIENNTFTHNYRGLWVSSQLGMVPAPPVVTIANNRISYSYDGLVYDSGRAENNTVSKTVNTGIYAAELFPTQPQRPVLSGNTITDARMTGITIFGTYKIPVVSNVIYNTRIGIFISANNSYLAIDYNLVTHAKDWAMLASSAALDPSFSDNSITVTGNRIMNCGGGIHFAKDSHGILVYHNNIIDSPNSTDLGSNSWSYNGEGNYWNDYKGTDLNLDGIGDTQLGIDRFPFMQENGWETKFWLTVSVNYPSIPFQMNGTDFATDSSGHKIIRLGYSANYQISFPPKITLSSGDVLTFERWGDSYSNATRIMKLSTNSTIQVLYTTTGQEFPTANLTTIVLTVALLLVAIIVAYEIIRHLQRSTRRTHSGAVPTRRVSA